MEIRIEIKLASGIETYNHSGIADLAEASRVFQKYRDDNGLQPNQMYAGGKVYDGERHVATVTYNGKVWSPDSCGAKGGFKVPKVLLHEATPKMRRDDTSGKTVWRLANPELPEGVDPVIASQRIIELVQEVTAREKRLNKTSLADLGWILTYAKQMTKPCVVCDERGFHTEPTAEDACGNCNGLGRVLCKP